MLEARNETHVVPTRASGVGFAFNSWQEGSAGGGSQEEVPCAFPEDGTYLRLMRLPRLP